MSKRNLVQNLAEHPERANYFTIKVVKDLLIDAVSSLPLDDKQKFEDQVSDIRSIIQYIRKRCFPSTPEPGFQLKCKYSSGPDLVSILKSFGESLIENNSGEKSFSEKAQAAPHPVEKPSVEKSPSEKPSAEKPSVEQSPSEKPSVESLVNSSVERTLKDLSDSLQQVLSTTPKVNELIKGFRSIFEKTL